MQHRPDPFGPPGALGAMSPEGINIQEAGGRWVPWLGFCRRAGGSGAGVRAPIKKRGRGPVMGTRPDTRPQGQGDAPPLFLKKLAVRSWGSHPRLQSPSLGFPFKIPPLPPARTAPDFHGTKEP